MVRIKLWPVVKFKVVENVPLEPSHALSGIEMLRGVPEG
jgi:hypothetical protein